MIHFKTSLWCGILALIFSEDCFKQTHLEFVHPSVLNQLIECQYLTSAQSWLHINFILFALCIVSVRAIYLQTEWMDIQSRHIPKTNKIQIWIYMYVEMEYQVGLYHATNEYYWHLKCTSIIIMNVHHIAMEFDSWYQAIKFKSREIG